MTLTIREHVMPLIEEEAQQLLRLRPRQAEIIRLAMEDFRTLYAERVFEDIPQLLTFCAEVDQMPSVRDLPPDLVEPVRDCRRRIVATVAREYVRQRRLTMNDIDPDREMRRRTRRRNQDRRERNAEELRGALEDYISLAAQVGEHEVLQVLISAGVISEDEIPRAVRILRSYLGRSARQPGTGGDDIDILGHDEEILERQTVRRVMQRMIRKRIYDVFLAQGGDTLEDHERLRRGVGGEAEGVMRNMAQRANVPFSRHQDLFNERRTFFEQAANLPLLPCFVRTIQHQGRLHPLGSWRQRINVTEALRQRHVYPAPEPGGGKTFIPLWLFELINEQRRMNNQPRGKMLYVSPKMVLDDLPNRVRPNTVQGPPNHCYYVPGLEPTVGVVQGGMTIEQMNAALANEVVFWPYSMLHATRDDESLYERIISYRDPQTGVPFTQVVFDEAQLLKGNGEWNRIGWEIVHRTEGLYDQGNVMFMSGTPATNHLGDLRNVAEILEPRTEGQENVRGRRNRNGERSLHPAVMRNMLERVIILDDPEEWERFVTVCDYDLYDEEYQFLRTIINDETMHAKQKIDACLLAIRCPQLMSNTPNMRSGLFDYMTIQLNDDLTQKNTVLVGEFMRSQAVLRERDQQSNDNGDSLEEDEEGLYFYARLQEYCERWSSEHGNIPVHLHVIHGNTSERDRQTAFAQAAESDSSGTSKTVIFAYSSCLDLGKDLRYIRRMISLEWPYNSPQAQQLLKRSLRAGNTDIHMTVFYARRTIEEGIFHYAQDKYRDVRACLYGQGGITDAEIRRLSQQEGNDEAPDIRILSQLDSPEQREERIQRWLQNRGMRGYRDFWMRHRDAFRQRLETADASGTGDRTRYTASLVAALEQAGVIEGNNYLHAHSKGLSLDRMLHRVAPREERNILNIDAVEYMLEEGRAAYRREGNRGEPRVVAGSIAEIGKLVADRVITRHSIDAVVLDELDYARSILPPEGEARMSQRARAIRGALHALRDGGTMVINIPRDGCTQEEFERFCTQTLPAFGCTVVRQWTGEGRSTDNEGDAPFRIFTVVARKTARRTKDEVIGALSNDSLQFTHSGRWGETREATRLQNEKRKRKLPSLIHTKFQLGRNILDSDLASPQRAQQIVHLRALEEAAQVVRSYAANTRDFAALSAEQRAEIAEWGVQFLPQLSTTARRPAFRLAAFPDRIFFPYDRQWEAPEA